MTDERLDDETGEESEEERERYRELLEELRTVVPGVSVVFGFLLTTPFSQRFGQLDLLGRRVFAGALLGTVLAAITLWSPAAFHRVSGPGQRATRLKASIVMQVGGMSLLLVSISMAVFVVGRLIFRDTAVGVGFALATFAVGLALWYVIPLFAGARQRD